MGRELRRKEEKKNKKGKERQEISTEPNYSGLTLLKIIGAIAIILFVLYYFIAVFITKEVDISGKKSDTTSEESKNSSSSNVSNAILAQRTFEQSEEEYYVYYCDFSDEDKTISSILNNKSNITLYRVDTSSALNQNYVTEENGNLLSYQGSLRRMMEREQIREEERNVCVSHQFYLPVGTGAEQVQRMDSEICTVGNIDQVSAEILKQFDYSALGHIHKPMKVGGDRIRYCGTPMQYSVSEAGQKKAILMVELKEKGTYSVTPIPLNAPHEVRIIKGELNEILKQECEDYVSVLLTDRMDLDICDMQDRLYTAFPNLLEIRRERWDRLDYEMADSQMEMDMDPYLLCCSFLKDLNEEEKALLKKVIGEVQEEQE